MADQQGLDVAKIDCLHDDNGVRHNTLLYETEAVILRRGEQFKFVITANNVKVDLDEHKFEVVLSGGHSPSRRNGSYVQIERVEKLVQGTWGYEVATGRDNTLDVTISIPAHALVAKYKLSIVSIAKKGRKRHLRSHDHNQDVYILFNPWCRDDEVFMEDNKKRTEYVLNDDGAIYWGAKRAKQWFFGQFEDTSLRCAFFLLERVQEPLRDTAREVARAISALANHFDNDGVLVGNWSNDFSGGRKPWEWTGSAVILAQFLNSGGEPVQFGQCWVFSGLVTALLRALGIPTRSVTNYDSAHDADSNLTYDKYYDHDGSYLEEESSDSCWNFHVWNDCWFARPDLPPGYGGWQAIDATPQELSSGIYRTGPAPLKAVKEGHVSLRYDCKFVFAEVNADTVYWKKNKESGEFEPLRIDSDNVGHFISTKAVGEDNYLRHDITDQYKYEEKSVSERIAVKHALKIAKNPVAKVSSQDIVFKIASEDITVGENALLHLSAENTSDTALDIDVVVTAHIVRYNGVALERLPPMKGRGTVSAKGTENLEFKLLRQQYWKHVDENPLIRFSFMARVDQTDQVFVDQKVVDVNIPSLKVTLIGLDNPLVPGNDVTVDVEIPQPQGFKSFTNCVLEFDGSAVNKPQSFKLNDIRAEGKTYSVDRLIKTRSRALGRRHTELLVTFSCHQLSGLSGSVRIPLQ